MESQLIQLIILILDVIWQIKEIFNVHKKHYNLLNSLIVINFLMIYGQLRQ